MVNNSKVSRICTVPSLLGDCGEIQKLTVVSGAVNLEVQQTYESHDTATSLSLGSGSARCYKLGPCFDSPSSVEEDNKPVVARLSKYYPSEKAKLLVQNFSSFPVVGWHIPDETYCKWVKKLEKRLEQKWRDLRIYEAIMLSTRRISFDSPLMSALMCFWDKSCNAFLLPEGPMGITMEDVVAITSCSPVGIELSTLGTDLPDAKNTYLGIGVSSYGNFASRAMALRDKEQEEMSFYLYWICKFIVCNRSVMVLKGFQCVAETIFHAKGPIALAPFLLGLAYNCLGNILRSDFSEHVSGPLWLVVLWAQAYFSPIAASSIATHLRRPRKQNSNSIYSYGDYIIFSQVQCEKTFGECFNYLTDNKRKRQGEEWNPFLKREFGADWFLNFTFHQKLTRDEKDAWKAVLIARDLPAYFSPPSFFLEPYSPNQFARQLGHLQSVPVPFYQTINQPWHSRNTVAANVLKHAEKDYFIRKSAMSQVNQILWRPSSDHAFDFWWLWCWANVASYVSEAKKHFVSKFGNGPRKMHKKRRATRTQKLQREPTPKGGGSGKVGEVEEEESSSSSSEGLPSNKEGKGKEVDDGEEESSSKDDEGEDDDVDMPLTKLRHRKPSADENDMTLDEYPSSEDPVNTEHGRRGLHSSTEPCPAVNVEQQRKKLKQYMDMSIESIYETDQLNNMERTVDAIYHHSGDALETPILGDLRKQLTGLKNKIPSLLSSINSAESECGSLHKQNPDLPAKLNQEKLALKADESRLSELTSEEAILELEIQKLMEKKESVLSQKVSAAESAERRKQKIEGLKNIEENIKKAEYSCFQKRNEMSKVNATINATLMDAKRVLFK
ncbi:trichohyalin [Salix suchowensis]|nr:trichohyalin [Salix suchowensis]